MNSSDQSSPRVYVLRHGQTAWSRSGRHTGRTDLTLTEQGENEARALAPWLHDIDFSKVLVSPLLRARRSCELADVDKEAEIEPDLTEWNYGDYEGALTADIQQQRPNWSCFADGCPNGESPSQISERADRVIARIGAMQGNVALFSHGGFLCALVARWIGLPVDVGQHFCIGTASLSVLGTRPRHPHTRAIASLNAVPGRYRQAE